MRVLLIDDQPESVQAVLDEIRQQLEGSDPKVVNFDNYKSDIEKHNPHVIVLDLLKGSSAEPVPGIEIHGYIWGPNSAHSSSTRPHPNSSPTSQASTIPS